jgi:DNA invertase Pin-like site-specific DNA recombinase
VDIYKDEGISGAKPPLKRPDLKRLLDDVEAGKVDMILFTKLDRWFRSVKEYFKVQDVLDNHKVEWKTIHENYDTTTANGQMAITIFLAVAQNERDRTAERIRTVLEHKRKNKEACFGGNVPPFGYKKEPGEDGKPRLVKDPETQQAAQDFWDILVTTNNRNKAIRHMLNEYGIQKDLKAWKRISQTEFYCGMYKGVQDYCPAYVTPENFLKYQERDNIKNTPSGTIYYFRGMMRCPKCGRKMAGDRGRRPGRQDIKTYRCTRRGRDCDNHGHVSEKKTEKYLLENLDQLMLDTISEVEIEAKDPKNKSNAERVIKTLNERLRRLNIMYMAGNKTDEEYFKENAEIKLAISKAEKELATSKPRKVDHLKDLLKTDYRGMYDKLTEERKQEFWQDLIKEIKIDGREPSEVIFYT